MEHRDDPAVGRFLALAVDRRPAEELYDIRVDPGCLDNLATRVHVNANAYWMRIPYVDGGTLGLMGKVHVVVPPETSCVECTLNSSHYRIIEQRYSCTGADTTFVEPKLASEVTTTRST